MINDKTLFDMIVTKQRSYNNKIKIKIHKLRRIIVNLHILSFGVFSKKKQFDLYIKEIDRELTEIINIMDTIGSSDGYSYDISQSSKEIKTLLNNKK